MLFGCSLQPKAKQSVAKLVAASTLSNGSYAQGELHLTGVYLTEGESATLYVHMPTNQRLAVARLSSTSPSTKILLQMDLANGESYALEVVGGTLDVVGFVDPGDFAATQPLRKTAPTEVQAKNDVKLLIPETKKVDVKVDEKVLKPEIKTPDAKKPELKKPEAPMSAPKPGANKEPETKKDTAGKVEAAKQSQTKKDAVEDFIPTKKFLGAKPGMVFKKGAKGLGYYKDTYVPPPPGAANTLKRKADAPATGAPAAKKQTLPCGLKYEVVKASTSPKAAKATRGRQVQVRYDGRLASSGRRFDKGVIRFKLGAGEVIKGWDLGVDGMCVGEKRRLLIPASLGYGSRGAPPDIPPNAALTFDVELIKV